MEELTWTKSVLCKLHSILFKPGEIKTNQSPHHEAHGLTLLTLLSNDNEVRKNFRT